MKIALSASPERICWGSELYCPADDLARGHGTIRMHPAELIGDDWFEWARKNRGGCPLQR